MLNAKKYLCFAVVLIYLSFSAPLLAIAAPALLFDKTAINSDADQNIFKALEHAFQMSYGFSIVNSIEEAEYVISKKSAGTERDLWQLKDRSGKIILEVPSSDSDNNDSWILAFTKKAVKEVTGKDSVLGSTVVFVSGRGNKRDIVKFHYGLETLHAVADEKNVIETQPAISYDEKITWIRKKDSWELLVDGQVISSGEMHLSPAFDPEAGAVVAAMSGTNETSLYIFKDGNAELLLSNGGIAVSPAFSPDGKNLLYIANYEEMPRIFIHKRDGHVDSVAPFPPVPSTDPAWSPDGKEIVYVINEKDIVSVKSDGTDFKQLTDEQGYNMRPTYSPDGQLIMFSSDRNGYPQLYVMKRDGSDPRLVLPSNKNFQSQAYWSHSNAYLARP